VIVAERTNSDPDNERAFWVSIAPKSLPMDLKVTGANRELAQWLLDHDKYSAPIVAGWLGCGVTRIKELRVWAKGGFVGSVSRRNERARNDARPPAMDQLNSQGNFPSSQPQPRDDTSTDDVVENGDDVMFVEISVSLHWRLPRHRHHTCTGLSLLPASSIGSPQAKGSAEPLSSPIIRSPRRQTAMPPRTRSAGWPDQDDFGAWGILTIARMGLTTCTKGLRLQP
jgi:hypothetical protein